MDWEDTPEQATFRSEVRAFIRDSFPPGYRPDTEAEQSLEPEDVWGYNWPADRVCPDPIRREAALRWAAALAGRGWITPHWPTRYGGAGLSAMAEFILQEEMMRARVPTVNGIGAFLLGPTLLEHGTEEQRARHLPMIARGETTWAQGFSEPGAGSDLASLRTRATRSGDSRGGHYVVNGQKVWTSLGQYADWLFVRGRLGPGTDRTHADTGMKTLAGRLAAQYADTNKLVVLYPQAEPDTTFTNPKGCWDWWGYLGGADTGYATRSGPQMVTVMNMVHALGG